MSYLLYLIPLGLLIITGLIFAYIKLSKKSNHTVFYSEGLRNENDGRYDIALDNYENALSEIRKQNADHKFGEKITQRIKILRSTIEFEKYFQKNK